MKKTGLVIPVLMMVIKGHACGWWPESDFYFFYNLFNQTNISEKAYYPFLRDNYNAFFQPYNQDSPAEPKDSLGNKGNLQLWKTLLPQWTLEEISQALYTQSDEDEKKVWSGKKSSVELSAKQYMDFARRCSDAFAYRNQYSWDYDVIVQNQPVKTDPLLKEGIKLFNEEKIPQLKARYGYQVVRILHYTKTYQEAVDFFNDHLSNAPEKNEIYYYTLDQVAGCYYSLEDPEQAAYLYVQVFSRSIDRKKSAYVSYKFCNNKDAEGKSFFQTSDDSISYIVLKSISSFSDDIAGLQKLAALAPNDPRTELLFMRSLNNLERKVWPTHLGMEDKTIPDLQKADSDRVKNLYAITSQVSLDPRVTNHDFWLMAGSYLTFLSPDITQAQQQLSKVKSPKYQEQKAILNHVYTVFSWKDVNAANEKYLVPVLQDILADQTLTPWDEPVPSWKHLLLDQVAHLYYVHGQLAKAFLVHNRLEAINGIFSLSLINDLLAFCDQPVKNDFENLLMKKTDNLPFSASPLDYLNMVKGLYYLQAGEAKVAYDWLRQSSLNEQVDSEDYFLSDYVPATIFSNNIRECFTCTDSIMKDSVYLASLFSFIETTFTKADLARHLIQLDSLTHQPVKWKSKLAHYLLANYYFNVSNTGYFRGTFSGQSNCCHYRYFFWEYDHHRTASSMIDSLAGFNLFDIEDHGKTDNGLADKAYAEYKEVITMSDDPELNARCLYMMAKCELNKLYNSAPMDQYSYYEGDVNDQTQSFKNSFQQLKNNYSDTHFYQKIIRECSFFRYYCSL